MADYRLSAQVIKRSEGKSSVASAAYRAGQRLADERTGEVHDYGRKGGVLHAEVLTPDQTPDWMHDRAQLWNAVEAVERRKDAQLAREIQLSLPHELTDAQRLELVRDFAQEQFVNHGMIADIAVHAPAAGGDERNHHAHIMLTMRELTGDGFGKKNRDWNSPETLAAWREQWAHYQNRTLEHHGHEARVDHRSYEAQGVDREPTQHLGPVAHDMEKQGKASRIGDENRAAERRNSERAQLHAEAAYVASRKASFEGWAQQRFSELDAAQDLTRVDLDQKHHTQRTRLEAKLNDQYGQAKATVKAELQTVEKKLEATGVRKVLRDVFGRTRTDKTAREALAASLRDIQGREQEQRQGLEARQDQDRDRLNQRMDQQHERLAKGIENARDRREGEGWRSFKQRETPQKPAQPAKEQRTPKAAPPAFEPPEKRLEPKPPRGAKFAPARSKATPNPRAEPSEKLGLDDRKNTSDVHLGDKNTLARPWESGINKPSPDGSQRKPWESGNVRDGKGRERGPSRGKGDKPK